MIDTHRGLVARQYDLFYQELVGPLKTMAAFDHATGLNWATRHGCTSFIRRSDAQRHRDMLRSALLQTDSRLIVELGCGLGGYGVYLAKRFDSDLLGLDASRVAVRLAQELAKKSEPGARVRFKKANIARTGLPTGSVAALLAIDSIYLLPNRLAIAAEVARLLGPGGALISTMFETPPVSAHDMSWGSAFMQNGLTVTAYRDVTRSWRAYMLEKHTLRWQARKLLIEQCGESVKPHLEFSQTIVKSRSECLAHVKRWELCLQKPFHERKAVATRSPKPRRDQTEKQ